MARRKNNYLFPIAIAVLTAIVQATTTYYLERNRLPLKEKGSFIMTTSYSSLLKRSEK